MCWPCETSLLMTESFGSGKSHRVYSPFRPDWENSDTEEPWYYFFQHVTVCLPCSLLESMWRDCRDISKRSCKAFEPKELRWWLCSPWAVSVIGAYGSRSNLVDLCSTSSSRDISTIVNPVGLGRFCWSLRSIRRLNDRQGAARRFDIVDQRSLIDGKVVPGDGDTNAGVEQRNREAHDQRNLGRHQYRSR